MPTINLEVKGINSLRGSIFANKNRLCHDLTSNVRLSSRTSASFARTLPSTHVLISNNNDSCSTFSKSFSSKAPSSNPTPISSSKSLFAKPLLSQVSHVIRQANSIFLQPPLSQRFLSTAARHAALPSKSGIFRICGTNPLAHQLHHSPGGSLFHIFSLGFRTRKSDDFTGLQSSKFAPSTPEAEKPETETFLSFLRSKATDSGPGPLRSPNPFERTADRTPTRVALGSIFDADSQNAKRVRRPSKDAAKTPLAEQDERLLRALQTGFQLGHQHSSKPSGLFGSLATNEKGKRSPFATVVGFTLKLLNGILNGMLLVLGFWLLYSVYKVWQSNSTPAPSSSSSGTKSGTSSFGPFSITTNSGNYNEIAPETVAIRFNDVRGANESKAELEDIVEFLNDPTKFTRLGARVPRGVLLVGPPGIGKTLLAKAIAGEAGVPFFYAAGSEFDEVFVGTGAKRVRQLFAAAKAKAPCVVFIDEIDSVGGKRTSSPVHPYANQTINQLLAEMDGFLANEGVMVLGATNQKEHLDKALTRPGRFDMQVFMDPPDHEGRKDIFDLYLSRVRFDPESVSLEKLAASTTGFTGADIENMVNQAALRAAILGEDAVTLEHLWYARDKIIMGPAKKRIPDRETNENTAWHEAGHAIVMYFARKSAPTNDSKPDPVHKVTIIPRGRSLGHTSFLPEKDVYSHTRAQLQAQLDACMGGRAAEDIVYGPERATTGAANDLSVATQLAEAMVKLYGMSDKVGLRSIEAKSSVYGMANEERLSEKALEMVDAEVARMLRESYERAKSVLIAHRTEHRALYEALLKYETLNADEVESILENPSGYTIVRTTSSSTKSSKASQDKDKGNVTEKPTVHTPTQPNLSGRAGAINSDTPAAPVEHADTAASK